jgi:hypothetical protein
VPGTLVELSVKVVKFIGHEPQLPVTVTVEVAGEDVQVDVQVALYEVVVVGLTEMVATPLP